MNVRRFLGNIAKSYLAIGALSVSAFAGADEFYNPQGWNNCCAPQCAPCAPAPHCCPPPPCCEPPACNYGYNPPAYLRCNANDCCNSFVDGLGIRADFLWWRPSVEGLALGSEETIERSPTTLGGVTNAFNHSSIKKPKFKYDPGFRLGLTHNCECWDVALTWTHFHSKANTHGASDLVTGDTLTGSYEVFVPYWERVAGVLPDFAKGHWTFDLDLIDLEFGSKYYVCNSFVVRPHVGLRGGRIDQGFHFFSFADRTTVTGFGDFSDYRSFGRAKNDFWAVGPRVGVDLELDLGCGFAVVGQAAGSILFGKTERHAREEFVSFTTTGTVTTSDTFEYRVNGSNNRLSRAITDLAIGLKWEHCFCWCNHYHPVSLAVLWEHHAFYDFNDFSFGNGGYDLTATDFPILPSGYKQRGDIFTQGLTVALNVGF